MPRYKVTENPPPFTQGETTVTEMDTEASSGLVSIATSSNRLVDTPLYRVVQSIPARPLKTIVNTTIINNNTTIVGGANTAVSAEYFNTLIQNNISGRTLLSNNGGGTKTFDDNPVPIWNSASMKIQPTIVKEVLDVQLRFTLTTDTLGGGFQIEAFSNSSILIIEEEASLQEQNFNINFKLIINQSSIDNGIKFFITPELGMIISIKKYSLIIIKG